MKSRVPKALLPTYISLALFNRLRNYQNKYGIKCRFIIENALTEYLDKKEPKQ